MKVCIHRGARQIGGTLVEVEAQGARIVLDVGLPLEVSIVAQRDLLPDVAGLWARGDGSLRGVVISHGHPDHSGLADLVDEDVPIYIGEATAAILAEAAFFVPASRPFNATGHLHHRRTFQVGPFAVTPWLVDHSAFDAYAILVEADGRRLLYTGDVRGHGRKPETLTALARAVGAVDVVLMEGTRVAAHGDGRPAMSEQDVEDECAARFVAVAGMALAFYSPQNVDRLVSLYRAARRAGRTFVMDLYAASIAAATGRSTVPQSGWEGVRVYLPRSQRRRVIDAAAYECVEAVRAARVYPQELCARPEDFVMTCRASMLDELERARCLDGAEAVWSMWPGYLERDQGAALGTRLERLDVGLSTVHASGHATPQDLGRFVTALGAERVVPVHTDAPERFGDLFDGVDVQPDARWWPV